jgi:N4-(beta-N-acetylglucosaminyl)-L-asparaginase
MIRRSFLKSSILAVPAIPASVSAINISPVGKKPIVISTWDFGKAANSEAWKILSSNGRALDAIEAGAKVPEADESNATVGYGGYPDRDGRVTLDACIMDEKGNCGAVMCIEHIKHPISVARKVMETTPHVMLVGQGAQQFALQNGFNLESGELSDDAKKAYKQWLEKSQYKPEINIEKKQGNGPFAPMFFDDGTLNHDTMGLVAMDANGDLSGAVTTSGMAYKIHGRVGDSPIIGAGLFVDNEVGAATSSGVGEEVIRICGTHTVVEYMRNGLSPEQACKKACERIIKRDPEKAKSLQVGFLAMNKKGEYGAYAIQKGFVYSVKSNTENKIHTSKFLI